MKALICIPTYNERANIEYLIGEIFKNVDSSVELLFIDDNSPDGTGVLLDEIIAQNSRVHVMHRAGKQGLASAYIQGFQWGLERGYDWLLEMDADLSHNPLHLHEFLNLMQSGRFDVVCGSRYVDGGGVSNWSQGRLMLSRLGSIYSTLWLRYPVKDWTGGFNAWSKSALKRMNLANIRTKGYAFQIDLKYRALLTGQRLIETPIVFQERRAGQSKMSGSIVKEAIVAVAMLRWVDGRGELLIDKNKQAVHA